jgi:hypothetical protein
MFMAANQSNASSCPPTTVISQLCDLPPNHHRFEKDRIFLQMGENFFNPFFFFLFRLLNSHIFFKKIAPKNYYSKDKLLIQRATLQASLITYDIVKGAGDCRVVGNFDAMFVHLKMSSELVMCPVYLGG